MTLDDLERQIGVLWIFWRFWAARHIARANCTETNWDRYGEAAYEIFSIERRFRRSRSRFSTFKETCALGHQRVPVKVATKWLEIDWQFANRNCYRLSRVPWALAQISCYILYLDLLAGIGMCMYFSSHPIVLYDNWLYSNFKKKTFQFVSSCILCAKSNKIVENSKLQFLDRRLQNSRQMKLRVFKLLFCLKLLENGSFSATDFVFLEDDFPTAKVFRQAET